MLSVIALLSVSAWRITGSMQPEPSVAVAEVASSDTDVSAGDAATQQQEKLLLGQSTVVGVDASNTSNTDPIAMIGPMVTAQLVGQYAGLQDQGTYSSSTAALAAGNVAANMRAVVSYKTYALADLKTDTDTSYQRMLTYRADLRTAFAPLLKNTLSELDLFAKYEETSDPTYLTQLRAAAVNYDEAIALTAHVVVPRDAVNYHLSVLNAMSEFSATIEAMSVHGEDALASAALLRTYNKAEADMYNSFNALGSYYSQKTP
ncbi:MAG: hypothetical protein JWM46_512 [Candidatus Kaiserbacteria bacterium]|nr:hypothetical protein [Candidatus Kaiserbacteria bacterium]